MAVTKNKGKRTPRTLRVAAVQMRFAATIDENLARIDQLARQAARRRADAVLFPECADNRRQTVIAANLDLDKATGRYAHRGARRPAFLAVHWKAMVRSVRQRAPEAALDFDLARP